MLRLGLKEKCELGIYKILNFGIVTDHDAVFVKVILFFFTNPYIRVFRIHSYRVPAVLLRVRCAFHQRGSPCARQHVHSKARKQLGNNRFHCVYEL